MEVHWGEADLCLLVVRWDLFLIPLSQLTYLSAVLLESLGGFCKFKTLLPGCRLSRMRGACPVSRKSLLSADMPPLSNICSSVMPLARILCTRPRGRLAYYGCKELSIHGNPRENYLEVDCHSSQLCYVCPISPLLICPCISKTISVPKRGIRRRYY